LPNYFNDNEKASIHFPDDSNPTATDSHEPRYTLNARIARQLASRRLRLTNRFRNTSFDARLLREGANLDSLMTRNETANLNNEYLYIDNNNLSPNEEAAKNHEPEEEEVKKKIYHWRIAKFLTIKIPFDHFSLLAMLDKNESFVELIATLVISLLVALFASLILYERLYDDMVAILFCFIIASCHYSLIKSVQPDSSSPIHGFNSLTALSRPIYFCLVCSIILVLRFLTIDESETDSTLISAVSHQSVAVMMDQNDLSLFRSFSSTSKLINTFFEKFSLYGYFLSKSHLESLLSLFETFLLFFPLVFTFGLFPQITTFVLCILEQIDMYIFGGTAMNNLVGAFLSVARSIFFCLVLSAVLFSSIYSIPAVFNSDMK
jgi:hypothetical protein